MHVAQRKNCFVKFVKMYFSCIGCRWRVSSHCQLLSCKALALPKWLTCYRVVEDLNRHHSTYSTEEKLIHNFLVILKHSLHNHQKIVKKCSLCITCNMHNMSKSGTTHWCVTHLQMVQDIFTLCVQWREQIILSINVI